MNYKNIFMHFDDIKNGIAKFFLDSPTMSPRK